MTEPSGTQELSSRIGRLVSRTVPGVAVAAVGAEGIRWSGAIGSADLTRDTAMTLDTAFLWFSMTKIVTATLAMCLVDEGRLGLEDRAVDWYPPFDRMRTSARMARVTVRHLLSHSSGIANPIPVRWVHPATVSPPDAEAFLDRLLRRYPRLRSEPGTIARYSNVGFLVLGAVIARAGGAAYPEAAAAHVLRPLGMNSTGFHYEDGVPSAVGYQRRRSAMTPLVRVMLPRGIMNGPADGFVAFRPFNVYGAAYGGLVGPLSDAARFLQMHLCNGELQSVRILSEESCALMRRIETRGKRFDLGLGWFRPAKARHAAPAFVQHRGDGAAFANDMRIYPDLGLGVVMMGNATSYNREGLARVLVDRFG